MNKPYNINRLNKLQWNSNQFSKKTILKNHILLKMKLGL